MKRSETESNRIQTQRNASNPGINTTASRSKGKVIFFILNGQCCMPQPCGHPALQKTFKKCSGCRNAQPVILGADTKKNSVNLFKQLGWVPFYHEAKINKSILVYQQISGECAFYLTQMLVRNSDVNGRTSRPWFKRETEGARSFSVSTSRPYKEPFYSTFKLQKESIFKHYMDSYK